MKEALAGSELFPLATSSGSGMPNVIPIKFVFVEGDDELWLVDNFMQKTLKNLQQNPRAALYVYSADAGSCFQIKGEVNILTSGTDYERMKKTVHKTRPDVPAKSLVVMRVTGIFQCMPGTDAGERIDQ